MSAFFKKSIPPYGILLALLAGGLLHYFFTSYLSSSVTASPSPISIPDNTCGLVAQRVMGFNYIKPLLFADPSCESDNFAPIKSEIGKLVNAYKSSGDISNASVYLRAFEQAKWMGLNCDELYHPASLIKVPIMMSILRMAEDQPALLDKEIVFENIPKEMILSKQNYVSNTITQGKKYTVRELLRYMISYSDNNAQLLLIQNLKPTNFDHMFMDMGIGLPLDEKSTEILISAKDYSAFIKTLFNATYLGESTSEFALSLMNDCTFKEGFVKGLPAGIKVVHKFGEWDNKKDFELHESGIIYIQNKAYLLTIMTRGNSRDKLPDVIAGITKTIYDQLGKIP